MTQKNPSPDQIENEITATRAEIDETLDALQKKLSPGELLDQALGYAKEGGGEFAANFGRTVRDNPVPVALLGIGVGWLMLAGRNGPEERTLPGRDHAHSHSPGVATSRPVGSNVGGGVTGPASEHTDGGKTTAKRVGDKAARLAAGVKAQAGAAGQKLEEAREDLADRASSAGDKAGAYARQTGRQLSRVKVSAQSYYHENPLVVGGLALAAGAALGSILPPTRQEDKVVGEHSDTVKSAAKDVVAENVEKAQSVAKSALKSAKDEGGRQAGSTEKAKSSEKPIDPRRKAATPSA